MVTIAIALFVQNAGKTVTQCL